jgi:DNA gyrase inhibitor GyrI
VVPAAVAQAGAPEAKSPDVVIETRPAQRCATYRFTGERSAKSESEAKAKLEAWMKEKGLKAAGSVFFAYYDPPFTPANLRRNEVLIPIVKE